MFLIDSPGPAAFQLSFNPLQTSRRASCIFVVYARAHFGYGVPPELDSFSRGSL
jgi:hypothetical protein